MYSQLYQKNMLPLQNISYYSSRPRFWLCYFPPWFAMYFLYTKCPSLIRCSSVVTNVVCMHLQRFRLITHTQERSKRPAKAPPKKRAKVAHPTGSANVKISSATKGKQRRSLNLLLITMPLDVLFGVRLCSCISCICSTNDRYFATYHRRILSTCPVLRRSFAKRS